MIVLLGSKKHGSRVVNHQNRGSSAVATQESSLPAKPVLVLARVGVPGSLLDNNDNK